MKVAIVINEKRITPAIKNALTSSTLAEKYSIAYDLFLLPPESIENCLKNLNLKSYNAFVIGGGDGTVRTAIQVLIDAEVPIAILPLGSFNLLANTLQSPSDIDALFAMIKNNKTKQIDLAEVNGNIIINHAWIGFYYRILKLREKHKEILGKNRFLKLTFNLFNLFRTLPIYHLSFESNHVKESYRTCLVYIGNNTSSYALSEFGDRKSLSSGLLEINILACHTRWQLFLCMLSLLIRGKQHSEYVKQFWTDQLTIKSRSKLINVVIDGELFKLTTPLDFTNHQKKLKVIIP